MCTTLIILHKLISLMTHERMQIWFKVWVQQPTHHDWQSFVPLLQSLLACPPLVWHPGGRFDFAIISDTGQSNLPSNSLRGMLSRDNASIFSLLTGYAVVQIHIIFHLLWSNTFFAYVQRSFHTTTPPLSNMTDSAAGMHILKHVITSDGMWVGEIILLLWPDVT